MEPFELSVPLERADMTQALRSFPRVNRRRWLTFAAFTAAWVALLLGFGPRGLNAVVCGLLFAATTVATLGAPWVVPLRSRQAIGIGQPMRWGFGPDGVRLASSLGTSEIPWATVADLRAGGDGGALLVHGSRMVFAFPRGMTPEQASAVRGWWEQAANPAEPPADGPATPSATPGRIVARGTPTPAQAVALHRMARSLRTPWRMIVLPAVCGVLAGTLLVVGMPANWRADLALPALVLAVVVALLVAGALRLGALLSRLLAPLTARGLPRRIWGDEPVTWWFEPERLGMDSRASSDLPWSRVREVLVRADLLVFVLEPHMIIGTPLAAFGPGDAARVLELARAAGTRVRGPLPPDLATG